MSTVLHPPRLGHPHSYFHLLDRDLDRDPGRLIVIMHGIIDRTVIATVRGTTHQIAEEARVQLERKARQDLPNKEVMLDGLGQLTEEDVRFPFPALSHRRFVSPLSSGCSGCSKR